MAGLTREQRAEREAAKLAELQQEELTPEQEQELEQEEANDNQPVVQESESVEGEQQEGPADDEEPESESEEIAFVMMVRDEDKWPAPHTAQVHPDEVQNYYSGGWVEDRS
ncbi:hypothetical protein EGJ48_03460 [Pantoea dispersa]|uniref:hypothetical protein n=1 Tax=Pantoea dispersa TaxID=59814 RepID=UPI000F6893A8|nr:hypothetical protein [Pantoea dispersa]RRW77615.1 hypothetical protein EGJ48_03460 [Pantoea dispersa]